MIDLLEHQAEFISSDAVHTGLVGGFRSGKSHAGVLKTITKKLAYPGVDVAYYLPTYGLVKDIAYPKFSEFLDKIGVRYRLNKSDHEYQTDYGRIILRSTDNPDSIIGYEVGYSLIDEADIPAQRHMKSVFDKILARLSVPLPDGKPNSLDLVSTPEGFKFMYEFFVKKPNLKKHLIRARTENNPFISESYIEMLRMSYTDEQLMAYLNGEFVNLTSGNVYRNYSRLTNTTKRIILPGNVLHIGMDFNITKMNAVVHVVDGDDKFAVDEIVNAYDTIELCELIKSRYPGHKIIVYPDAAGKARKTTGKSDHDVIRSFRFTVRCGNQNPPVRDRVTQMNLAFKDKAFIPHYFVNDEQCPNYAEALEKQTYKNGEPDKTSGYDHITEAAGYFIYNSEAKKISYRIS